MEITEDLLARIEQAAALGLRCSQVSRAMGWSDGELQAKRTRHPEIEAAWARGAGTEPARYGRPAWEVTPEIVARTESYAAVGLTIEQIAHNLGISMTTFQKAKKEDPRLQDAYQCGKAKGIAVVANSLFQRAKGGDTTAQIFYLKNRAPSEWMDRRNHEIGGPGGKPLDTPMFGYLMVGGPGEEPPLSEAEGEDD